MAGEQARLAGKARKKGGGSGPVAVVDPQKNKVRIDRDYARKIIENPSILLEQAQYKPYKHGSGMTIGFTIRGIDEGSLLKDVGIKNDDVLLRLNGKDLLGPSSLMQAYAGLKGSNIITMDILRDDKIESIMLELE
jgi:general secretion pathway protein C